MTLARTTITQTHTGFGIIFRPFNEMLQFLGSCGPGRKRGMGVGEIKTEIGKEEERRDGRRGSRSGGKS